MEHAVGVTQKNEFEGAIVETLQSMGLMHNSSSHNKLATYSATNQQWKEQAIVNKRNSCIGYMSIMLMEKLAREVKGQASEIERGKMVVSQLSNQFQIQASKVRGMEGQLESIDSNVQWQFEKMSRLSTEFLKQKKAVMQLQAQVNLQHESLLQQQEKLQIVLRGKLKMDLMLDLFIVICSGSIVRYIPTKFIASLAQFLTKYKKRSVGYKQLHKGVDLMSFCLTVYVLRRAANQAGLASTTGSYKKYASLLPRIPLLLKDNK